MDIVETGPAFTPGHMRREISWWIVFSQPILKASSPLTNVHATAKEWYLVNYTHNTWSKVVCMPFTTWHSFISGTTWTTSQLGQFTMELKKQQEFETWRPVLSGCGICNVCRGSPLDWMVENSGREETPLWNFIRSLSATHAMELGLNPSWETFLTSDGGRSFAGQWVNSPFFTNLEWWNWTEAMPSVIWVHRAITHVRPKTLASGLKTEWHHSHRSRV